MIIYWYNITTIRINQFNSI